MNKLDYNYGHTPDPTTFRIQASQISRFFDYTNKFFREKLLGEEGFSGNTNSVLGTCLHYLAEMYTIHGSIPTEEKEEVYAYIEEQKSDLVDADYIRENLTPMWKELRSHLQHHPLSLAEPFVESQILPGITVGGSIDGIRCVDGTIHKSLETMRGKSVALIDWKTTSALSAPTSMSKGYEWQLLVYAYVLKKEYDINVVAINNTYITHHQVNRTSEKTGKPMKDYPCTITEVNKPVEQDSLDFIESIIKLVALAVQSFIQNPGPQRAIIAQDYRLIDHTAPLPFTAVLQEQTEMEI